jgi:adenylate cyclase
VNADPDHPPSGALGSDPVATWLLRDAHDLADTRSVIGELCQRLLATGFPLSRLFLSIRTLHPQVATIGYRWRSGESLPSETPREHGIDSEEVYLRSPIKLIHDGASELRRRLADLATPREFPILDELAAEGATDYLIVPLRFSSQRVNAVSIATDRPGGFSNAELARFKDLTPLLGLVLEIKETQRLASTLLDTYLGHDAGRRVLGGLVRRGDGITLAAALWYCDLRGFTATTEPLPRDEIIALLNDYFACMVGAVHRHGGEVLKFIGDALLAIFPADDGQALPLAPAIAAALEARRRIAELNAERDKAGRSPLKFGLALDAGEIAYGNIGSRSRLDFTAIGPAINHAARLLEFAKGTKHDIVVSESFAHAAKDFAFESLGAHALRGFGAAQRVFSIPDRQG